MIEIQRLGKVSFYLGKFNTGCFKTSAVWYEYYAPSELEIFRRFGADEDWIEKNLSEQIDSETELYYSVDDQLLTDREFFYVRCSIEVNDISNEGYLTYVSSDLTSANIILNDEVISFYSEIMLSFNDNSRNLQLLQKVLGKELSSLEELKIMVDSTIREVFKVPERIKVTS